MATLSTTFVVFTNDSPLGPGTWSDPVPDPADTEGKLEGLDNTYAPPRTTLADTPTDTNWEPIRFRAVEKLSSLYRCELTLLIYSPLEPEDQYVTADNPKEIYDSLGGGPMSLLGGGLTSDTEDYDQYYLGKRRRLRDDWAISEPISPTLFMGKSISVAVVHQADDGSGNSSGDKTGRYFSGIVTEFEDLGNTIDPKYRAVNLVFEPRFSLLGHRVNTRVFTQKTALQIVHAVLDDAGLYKNSSERNYANPSGTGTPPEAWTPVRDFTVQFNETDLDFVQRLLEEEGINYCFDHRKLIEGVVFIEDFKSQTPFSTTPTLDTGLASAVGAAEKEMAWNTVLRKEMRTRKFTSRDYNYCQPTKTTEVTAPESPTAYDQWTPEAYEYPTRETFKVTMSNPKEGTNGLGEVIVSYKDSEARNRAALRADVEASREVSANADTNAVGLWPGVGVTIAQLENTLQLPALTDGSLPCLVVSAEHVGHPTFAPIADVLKKLPKRLTADDAAPDSKADSKNYFNRLSLVPMPDGTTVTYRPQRTTARPTIFGIHPAVVVDEAQTNPLEKNDSDIVSEQIGRVRVRFLWDRRAPDAASQGAGSASNPGGDKPLSAWLRVIQPWAGAGYGVQFIPQFGMEVAVMFEDGDPDRPIIVGAMRNALHHSWLTETSHPSELLGNRVNATRVGFRSHSHAGMEGGENANPNGHNEFWFDDLAGHEKVFVRAERDLDERAGHTYQSEVVGSVTAEVRRDMGNVVDGNQTVTVDKDRLLSVTKDATEWAGGRETKINAGLDLLRVDGWRRDDVTGRLSIEVGTKDKDPQVPLDPEELRKAQEKYDAAKATFDQDCAKFRKLNDDYAEWLTRVKHAETFVHSAPDAKDKPADPAASTDPKPVDRLKEIAKLVNVGASPRPVKLDGKVYVALPPDEPQSSWKFCQDASEATGDDFEGIKSDKDALDCGDGELTKALRKDYAELDKAKREFQLQKSLVRSYITDGAHNVEAVELTDTLDVQGNRTEQVKGKIKLQGASVSIQTTGPKPKPEGKKDGDGANADPNAQASGNGDAAAKPATASIDIQPPESKDGTPGITIRVRGGSPPDNPALLDIVSHGEDRADASEMAFQAKGEAEGTLEVTAKGAVTIRTKETTKVALTEGAADVTARTTVGLMATEEGKGRGVAVLRRGLFMAEMNRDDKDVDVAKAPTASFQIVTDAAQPLDDGTAEPPPGVWIRANNITINVTTILVNGANGINVQSGKTRERILSPNEQKLLVDAAEKEKAFQSMRAEAGDKTVKREEAYKASSEANQAKQAASEKLLKNQTLLARARVLFNGALERYQTDVRRFEKINEDYATALTKQGRGSKGSIFAQIGVTNTPLEDLADDGREVNVRLGEEPENLDDSKGMIKIEDGKFSAKPHTQEDLPKLAKSADASGKYETLTTVEANLTPADLESPAKTSASDTDPWDNLKNATPKEDPAHAREALAKGHGRLTVDLRKQRKKLRDDAASGQGPTAVERESDIEGDKEGLGHALDLCTKQVADAQKAYDEAAKKADEAQQKLDAAKAAEKTSYAALNKANGVAVEAHDKAHTAVAYHKEPADPGA